MKINQLSLTNYCGFEKLDITFEPDITVIAGANGVGKSALLSAIAKGLSHVLRGNGFSKEPPIEMMQTDIKAGKDSLTVSATFSHSNTDIQVDISHLRCLSPEKTKELEKRKDEIRFAMCETKKESIEEQNLEKEMRDIELKFSAPENLVSMQVISHQFNDDITQINAANEYPIAVYYSTERLLSRLPPVLPKTKGIELATAYVRALSQREISLNDFANWYRIIEESEDAARSARIIQQLDNAISMFLDGVKELRLHNERPPRFSVHKNGEMFYLEQLSDGEKGLLALIFDLTRRLTIANPTSDNPIAEGAALVMIDEIELHLHPKWQREIIRKLQEIFKNCQFIITTHSPQVIGQIKSEKLRLLSHDETGKIFSSQITQAFGMDSSWVLQNIMGTPARDYETEQHLSNIFDAIDEGKYSDARNLANAMRSEIGDFPDLQEAIALLDRFDLLEQSCEKQ